MQKLVFTNGGGQTIDLTTGNFGITNWEGLSGVGLNIQTQQVPFQDGGVFLDALMEQREISVTVAIQDNNDLSARYERKRQLISALNPKLGEGLLVYTNDYLSRQIKAVPQLPIFENKNSNDAGTLKANVTFSCLSPYWEDLEDTVISLGVELPVVVENNGDVPCNIEAIISQSGSYTDVVIDKNDDEDFIKLKGTFNDQTIINTNVGEKSVVGRNITFDIFSNPSNINAIEYSEKLKCYLISLNNKYILFYDGKQFKYKYIDLTFEKIYTNPNKDIIIGLNGKNIYTSTDGENWTLRTNPTNYNLNACIFKVSFYIFGEHGTILKSSDGITWNTVVVRTTENLNCCYIDGDDAVGGGDNGIICTVYTMGAGTSVIQTNISENINGIVKTLDSDIIAVCDGGKIYKRVTINNFTEIESGITENLNSISCSTIFRRLYAVGENGTILISDIGDVWNIVENEASGNIKEIKYCESQSIFYYAILLGMYNLTLNGEIIVTLDNITQGENIKFIFETDETAIICVGNNLLISEDYKHWQLVENFGGTTAEKMVFAKDLNRVVCVFSNRQIKYSDDKGYSWQDVQLPVFDDVTDVCYNEKTKMFITVGGVILYSYDGINWVNCNIELQEALRCVIVSEKQNKYVACSSNYLYISNGGINWNLVENVSGGYTGLYVTGVECFYILNLNEGCKRSYDGINWQSSRIYGTNNLALLDVIFSQELGMFIGTVGTKIFSSADFITWGEVFSYGYYVGALMESKIKNCVIGSGGNGICVEIKGQILENRIQSIDKESNLNFNLSIGENKIRLGYKSGVALATIKYRQKYIGV